MSPARTILVAACVAVGATAGSTAGGQCRSPVALPVVGHDESASLGCPESGLKWDGAGDVQSRPRSQDEDGGVGEHHRAEERRLVDEEPLPRRMEGNGTELEMSRLPDCRHATAVQLLWDVLSREDWVNGSVLDDADYLAVVHHVGRSTGTPRKSLARLRRIQVSVPGAHSIDGRRFSAEIRLEHEGLESGRPGFDLVVPVDAEADLFQIKDSPVMSWLASERRLDQPCTWRRWFQHRLQCPANNLRVSSLLPGISPALHYRLDGCSATFVVMRAVVASREQLARLGHELLAAETAEGDGEELRPNRIMITAALPPNTDFSTLTSSELLVRNSLFGGSSCACLLLLLCTFLLARRGASGYATDLWQFALSKPVRYCMILDHWLAYGAAIAIPYAAYRHGLIDQRTGMPWEYQIAYGVCLLLHGTHELFWFSQMGDAAKRVSNGRIVVSALLGLLTLTTYELDLQFAFMAHEADSKLAYASAGIFVLSNLLMELLGFTALTLKGARPEETFKPRGMEVLHHVLLAHILELDGPTPGPDTTGINQFGFVLLRVFLEDLSQAVLQIAFLLWFGFSPLVCMSVVLSVVMAAHGLLAAPQEVLSWSRNRRGSGSQVAAQ